MERVMPIDRSDVVVDVVTGILDKFVVVAWNVSSVVHCSAPLKPLNLRIGCTEAVFM